MKTRVIIIAFSSLLSLQPRLLAAATEESDTILDDAPFTTARANALGGALSTIAEGLDAIHYNPAGIGGLGFDASPRKSPFTSTFLFPYAGVSMNQTADAVRKEFSAKSAQSDANAAAAIMDAHAGKRQYLRATLMPIGFISGRIAVAPTIDHQIAAVPVSGSPGQVRLRYRTFSGTMIGSSVADYANRLSLGVSQTIGTIQETYGTFNYLDIADVDKRKTVLGENRRTYTAGATNIGLTLRLPKKISPTFSVVARNMGNTKNRSTNPADEALYFDENLTVGASISPKLRKLGRLNVLLEASRLTQRHTTAIKKIHAGVELLVGGDNGHAPVGIRLGGNEAGISYGMHLNLALIGIEAESHAVNIGVNNNRVIERRTSFISYINIASF